MRRTEVQRVFRSSEIQDEKAISYHPITKTSNAQGTVEKLGDDAAKYLQENRKYSNRETFIPRPENLKGNNNFCCSAIRKMIFYCPKFSTLTNWCTLPAIVRLTTVLIIAQMVAATGQPQEEASFSPGIQKRQIYRESLAPSLGGVIPAGALSRERLKYNAQDAVGIEAPDGLVYQPRETDVKPGARDPEDINEILTLTKQLHPTEPTDYHGMIPAPAQKTTYLLRRPHKFSRNISPSIIHPDASPISPDNYQVADIPRAPHYKELLPNPRKFPTPFPFQTGFSNPPPADFNTLGSVLRFYSNPHFEGVYAPKFQPHLHFGGHLQNIRSYSQHSIIVI